MANVRIKDLTTTAATTASDDFFGVDGTTNGTRKLNAFSPTFGGNLTATGTIRFDGQLFCGNAGGIQIRNATGDGNVVDVSGGRNLTMSGAATFGGNLTVSGTGGITSSSISPLLKATTSALGAVPKLTLENTNLGAWNVYLSGTDGGDFKIDQDSTNKFRIAFGTGNVLIGGTIDGGQKLQVNGTAAISGALTAASFAQASAGASLAFGATANANTVFTNPGNGVFVFNKTSGQTGMILQLAAGAGASGRTYSIYSSEVGNGIGAGFFAIADENASANRFAISSAGQVQVLATTESSTTSTGSLAVSGGIGVAKAVNVGTYYGMVDGVTAPAATSGYAKIYVDTADGDLKVIFGDGTIKTIATDT